MRWQFVWHVKCVLKYAHIGGWPSILQKGLLAILFIYAILIDAPNWKEQTISSSPKANVSFGREIC